MTFINDRDGGTITRKQTKKKYVMTRSKIYTATAVVLGLCYFLVLQSSINSFVTDDLSFLSKDESLEGDLGNGWDNVDQDALLNENIRQGSSYEEGLKNDYYDDVESSDGNDDYYANEDDQYYDVNYYINDNNGSTTLLYNHTYVSDQGNEMETNDFNAINIEDENLDELTAVTIIGADSSSQTDVIGIETDTEAEALHSSRAIRLTENIHSDIFLNAFPNDTALTKLTSYEDIESSVNMDIPIPNNLNIVLSGDSLTRYQYLDLIYFLSHNGTWLSPDEHPHITIENDFSGWVEFYNVSNTYMHPYEQCDCYRPDGFIWEDNFRRRKHTIENRFFYEPTHNNRVTYLQKMGNGTFKFQWDVKDSFKPHGPLITNETDLNIIYEGQWLETIRDFICKMSPRPSVFIFNQGHWDGHLLVNLTLQDEIVNALKECNIISIFKTVTKFVYQRERSMEAWETELCNKTDYCQNFSWSGALRYRDYNDRLHFKPHIYQWANLHTLSILSSIAKKSLST